jgi:pimeloyl-ACP methyl ester carboxylesterase
MELKTIQTPHVPVRYYEGGSGQPLVFLHGAGGLNMDLPFLDLLAQRFHVYAPLVPGYGDSEECAELRDMLDFTLHTWDVVHALGLKDPILAGFSMGGMIAAEMAAISPREVSRLALIAPAGLWLDRHPIPDFFAMLPYELPPFLFFDAEAGAKAMSAGVNMEDPEFLQAFLVQNARQLGTASKILFPIPERGLSSRLYRIKATTHLIWGDSDKLVPPEYAPEFQRGIAGAKVTMIPKAGHAVGFEKPAELAAAIGELAA